MVTLDAIALNCILSLMMIQKSMGTKRNWKWLLGSLHEERLRRDSSEQLSIKKMTRQVHLSLCYICRKRRTGLRAVILILRWVSKGKNNLTLATTVEKLTIRKIVQEPLNKFKKEPHHLIEHVFCTLDVLDSAQFS